MSNQSRSFVQIEVILTSISQKTKQAKSKPDKISNKQE